MPEEVVLVTGVTGYIASHVVKLLLEGGHRVRGTVRSLQNTSKTEPLKNLVQDPKYPLELVEADLMKDEGWDKATEGCSALIHMASPFPNVAEANVKEDDVVVPAKEGTLRVLKAAVAAKIKRVVLTSSIVSIFAESVPKSEKVYTEEDWTDPESPTVDVYSKSKVLAEKAAWDYLKELPEEEKFELSVINPAFVLGPVLMESHRNATSVTFLSQIMNKTYPAMPKMSLNVCDIRDVAKAHVKALSIPEAVGKRHIIYSGTFWLKDIAAVVAREFQPQGYSVPTGQLPYFICWVASLFNKQMKSYILPRIGKTFKLDNKRMIEVLGIEPTPVESSILDMAYSLVDSGIVRKAKNYKQVGSRVEVPPTEEKVESKEEKGELKEEGKVELKEKGELKEEGKVELKEKVESKEEEKTESKEEEKEEKSEDKTVKDDENKDG